MHCTDFRYLRFLLEIPVFVSYFWLMLVLWSIQMQEMHKYEDFLDLNRLYSNDVHGIASVYGIEAAYQIIMKVRYGSFLG